MKIQKMTKKDFEALPLRKWGEDIGVFNSLVILPAGSRPLHDSGYRLLDFVAVRNEEAVCRLSGYSDVIHIDGIGGFGKDWAQKYPTCPHLVPPTGWSIDCLPKSGLLRMWPMSRRMTCGPALGSFEIYALSKEEEEKTKEQP